MPVMIKKEAPTNKLAWFISFKIGKHGKLLAWLCLKELFSTCKAH